MFQTMMDNIFNDLIMEGVVVVYLDNILIFNSRGAPEGHSESYGVAPETQPLP